jgi:two-component system chemotaxis response regulator CheY
MAKTIFLVDDSATIRMSMEDNLKRAGFNVQSAEDGVKALEKIKSGLKPDLIITDINMPNMGGIEFITKVRALAGFKFLPIITLTTESGQSRKDEGKKAGATGWLVKPVSGTELIKIIKQLLPGA